MKVLDHEPGSWFLLADSGRLFLDVNCEHGAVGYDVLIELDEPERGAHAAQGKPYLKALAAAISDSAPGLRGSQSNYASRVITRQHHKAVTEAIRAWRARQEPGAAS